MVSDEEIVAVASPARTKYIVCGKKELEKGGRLFEALKLGSALAGNLRQLCGYDRAPRGVRHGTAGWQVLAHVKWLCREDDDNLVPVVGFTKQKGWIDDHAPELKGQ
eukprot:5930747-Prymnesium_polylepis.1